MHTTETLTGASPNGEVEVDVTGGRVSRVWINPRWRRETIDYEIRQALTKATNEALARYWASVEAPPPPPPCDFGAAEMRELAADGEAMYR